MESTTSIAALKEIIGLNNSVINLLGYYASGDGGGGIFYYDANSTEADNGGTIIKPTHAPSTGVWKRIYDGGINVQWFGAYGSNVSNAFNSAIGLTPVAGGVIDASGIGDVTLTSPIIIDKPVKLLLGSGTIISPVSGYAIDIVVNDVQVVGNGKTVIKLQQGVNGALRNNQALRTNISQLCIDMNNVTGAIGVYHYGGWYNTFSDINIYKDKTDIATSIGFKIEGYWTSGDPLPTGSYGGVYIGNYNNITTKTLIITAALPQKTTTLTFINLDTERIIAENSLSLTFIQPILQGTGGIFFDLDNVAGLTCLGGDMEGTGTTIYNFGSSCRGIQSQGNQISGTGNIYMSGQPTASSYFNDDGLGSIQYDGSLQDLSFRNNGYINRSHIGIQFDGNVSVLSQNLNLTSLTQGNLDDTSQSGTAITIDTSGQIIGYLAYAGTNPRTLTKLFMFDNGGLLLNGLSTYANNAAAIAGGLTTSRLYKTATGQLMIVI